MPAEHSGQGEYDKFVIHLGDTWRENAACTATAEFTNGWVVQASGQLDPNGKPVIASLAFRPSKPGILEVTTNLLREMPSGRILKELRECVSFVAELGNTETEIHSEADWLDLCRAPRWPGRGYETPGITFAAMAFTYLRFVTEGNTKPVEALAEHMDCSRATASARLAQARLDGFLDRPGARNRGGRLTAKSERLLGLVPVDESGLDA